MPDFFDLPPTTEDSAQIGSRDYDIIQWCDTKLKDAIKFIEAQVGYDKIDRAVREIFAYEKSSGSSYIPTSSRGLSKTRINLVAKTAEDLTAMLTDTRQFWNYTTNNPKYEQQCKLANKGAEAWYRRRNIALRIGDIIRYYTLAGTGVAHMYYSKRLDDMMVDAEDPRNVFPMDPMSYHSFEDCLGVIIRRPRTPAWIKEEYGKNVSPDSGGIPGKFFGWLQRVIDGPGQQGGPLAKRSRADQSIPGVDTAFVNTMYLNDKRKNKTSGTVYMGKWEDGNPSNPWSYEVKPGESLYPFKRLIIWANSVLLYDGPSPYWCGKFPLIKLTLNPWPMSWFGKAPTWDTMPLNDSINSNLRVIDDHAAQVAQPGVIADRNVSRAEMNKVNTRSPGMKVRTNMSSGKGITIVNPPPLDNIIWEIIKWCTEMIPQMAGTADISAMASLNQIPSDDTIDTIMKAMTPGVRLRSRILEGFYTDLSEQFLYAFMEFDNVTKRIAEFGPTAVTPEDFDYDPNTMIPDDIPDGDVGDVAMTDNAIGLDNPRPLYVRAKMMLSSFACVFDPASLLNSAAQQELLKYFMLAKMGYISVFTLMEKMGIINFVPPTMQVPADEVGRLALQQQLGIGMIANAQGRKSTDSAPPSMGQNAGGPTIQTS